MTTEVEFRIPEGFPVDKYDVEQSSLVSAMQGLRPNSCWQAFIPGSGQAGRCEVFGALKLGSKKNTVHFFVLPYNFPRLWALFGEHQFRVQFLSSFSLTRRTHNR